MPEAQPEKTRPWWKKKRWISLMLFGAYLIWWALPWPAPKVKISEDTTHITTHVLNDYRID